MSVDLSKLYVRSYSQAPHSKVTAEDPEEYIGLESVKEIVERLMPYTPEPSHYNLETAINLLPEGMIMVQRFSNQAELLRNIASGDVTPSEEVEDCGIISLAIIDRQYYRIYIKNQELYDAAQECLDFDRARKTYKLAKISLPVLMANGEIILTQEVHLDDMDQEVARRIRMGFTHFLKKQVAAKDTPIEINTEYVDDTWFYQALGGFPGSDSDYLEFYQKTKDPEDVSDE